MSDTDHRDALAGGEDILASLSDDDVMYEHPVSQTGEPMDPVLFVRWGAILAAVRERDKLREAARDHVNAECRCGNGGSHDLTCDLIVTEDALRAALHREDGV